MVSPEMMMGEQEVVTSAEDDEDLRGTDRLSTAMKKSEFEEKADSTQLTTVARLEGGRNNPEIVQIEGDGLGVYKVAHSEHPFVRRGSCHKYERAAYVVDNILGFGFVPPTVIVSKNDTTGSLQQFLPNASTLAESQRWRYVNSKSFSDNLKMLYILDYILFNADRHRGNIMVEGEIIHAIDNESCFSDNRCFRPQIPGENVDYKLAFDIPLKIKNRIASIAGDPEMLRVLQENLSELLSEDQINACLARIRYIAKFMGSHDHLPDKRDVEYCPNNQEDSEVS